MMSASSGFALEFSSDQEEATPCRSHDHVKRQRVAALPAGPASGQELHLWAHHFWTHLTPALRDYAAEAAMSVELVVTTSYSGVGSAGLALDMVMQASRSLTFQQSTGTSLQRNASGL